MVLFEGIQYAREVLDRPRSIVVHTVRVDLTTPGLLFVVTPADPSAGRTHRARTTSEFLAESGADLAVNGAYFEPFHCDSAWKFYPRSGDPVESIGFTASGGSALPGAAPSPETIFVGPGATVRIGDPGAVVEGALTGDRRFDGGEVAGGPSSEEWMPRTAAGLDASGRTLVLVVADGRQGAYSEGVTLAEFARLVAERGAAIAVNLDGGGSSTLVARGADGRPVVLNSPIHTRVAGRERPVATHLGIRCGSSRRD